MYAQKLARMRADDIAHIIGTRDAEISATQAAIEAAAERRAFAKATADELGYPVLSVAIDRETPTIPVDFVLLKSLQKIGVRPFTTSSVTAYMTHKVAVPAKIAAQIIGAALIAIGVVGLGIEFFNHFLTELSLRSGVEIPLVAFWTHAFIGGAGIGILSVQHKLMPTKTWRHVYLNDAGRLVPREALEIARALKAEHPKVIFTVHQLEHKYGELLPDPFLRASLDRESYYIAAWDEPGFDGKLMDVK